MAGVRRVSGDLDDYFESGISPNWWRDDGCDASPKCVDCPLPVCKYDVRGGLRQLRNEERNKQIISLFRSRKPVPEIARVYGISKRLVYRILQHHRDVDVVYVVD